MQNSVSSSLFLSVLQKGRTDRALILEMAPCRAKLAGKEDDLEMDGAPSLFGKKTLEVSLDPFDRFVRAEAPAVGRAENVSVNWEGRLAVSLNHHHRRCLMPHTWERLEPLEGSGDFPSIFFEENFRESMNGARFAWGKAARTNERLNGRDRELDHLLGGLCLGKEMRCCFVDPLIGALSREEDGNE